jgi:hypothetical protein
MTCKSGCIAVLGILLISLGAFASAQIAGGTISGVVTDTTGAVVPGAEVTILNQATGVTRRALTNERGFYNAPNLLPGRYDLAITAPGFTNATEKNLLIGVGQEILANIQLQVGAVTETVEIKGESSQMALASSTLSNVVGGETVRDLPINGRDWTLLAALEPGVRTIEAQTAITASGSARANRGWGTQMSIGGSRPQQNNYRLDGISINDYSGGGPGSVLGSVLGVDAIEEFSVVTGNASADYGKTSGGVINAITRSGTNDVHGSAYEFARDSALDARNFFDGPEVPPFTRHQFGLALSGPIRRDRTFLFGDYEGLRQDLTTTQVISVPSRAARNGQLSSGSVNVDPKIAPYLALFPQPNGAERGDLGLFSFEGLTKTTENLLVGRLDHKSSPADNWHATFMRDRSEITAPDIYNFTLVGQISKRTAASVEETHIFGPSVLNVARFGYSGSVSLANRAVGAIDPRAADTSLGFVPGRTVGSVSISGVTRFVGGTESLADSDFHYNSYQIYDDLFYTRNRHSLRFGLAIEQIQSNERAVGQKGGSFDFGSLQAFLTNQPQTFTAPIGEDIPIYLRQTIVGVYARDDLRVRANLTLNLGLRYETATVPREKYGHLGNLARITDTQPKLGSPYFENPTLRNFSPRIGFAWDPWRDSKTAIRGAFGIYDTLPLLYTFELLVVNTAPFAQQGSVSTLPQGSFPTGAFASLTPSSLRYAHVEQEPKRAFVAQWTLNVQRQLGAGIVLQVGYAGQRGWHQPFRSGDANIVLPTATREGLVWPTPRGSGTRLNPNVGQIDSLAWISSNTYRALNVGLSRRRKDLTFGLAYTWAKSTDTSSSSVGANFNNSLQSPLLFSPEVTYGPSDFDKRHNLVVNHVWNLPHPRSVKGAAARLIGGWQFGGVFRASSGLPFSPSIGGDPLGMRNTNPFAFPDRLATPECADPVNPGNPDHYIKTECFVPPQPVTRLGNSGRNTASGPGIANLDLSLVKSNYIGPAERFNLQFRAECFNVLNHPNFAVPDRTTAQVFNQSLAALPNAGRLNSTSTSSRQIQLAVKLIW